MKRITFLLMSVLLGLVSASAAITTNDLYLTGNATPVGWQSGTTSPIKMIEGNDRIFTWTGVLKADGNRFAFLIDGGGWYPRIISTPTASQQDFVITSGVETVVYKFTSEAVDGGKENCFRVPETAEYSISIDLENETMIVTKVGIVIPPIADNLYLIGDATTAGFTTGSGKITMAKVEENVFTWTGPLKGTAEGANLRFKFIIKDSWSPAYTCEFTTPGHKMVTSGVETSIYKYEGGAGTYDVCFQVAETGTYKIDVNLETETMTCTKELPNYTKLYVVGGALHEDGNNWDTSGAKQMIKIGDGLFAWSGELYANTSTRQDGNQFKFINDQSWSASITPKGDSNFPFVVDTDYELLYKGSTDRKFIVTTPGTYTIKVDLKQLKVRIEEGDFFAMDKTQLYITGSATSVGWSPAGTLAMTKSEDGVFSWTGELSGGNLFKFLNMQGAWSKTVVAKEDAKSFELGIEFDLNYRPYESSPNDFNISVPTTDTYTVNVNLNTMKLLVTTSPDTGLSNIKVLPFEVVTDNGLISIVAEDNSLIQSVNIYDVTGKSLQNENFSKGIYILKVKYNDREYTQKIMF